MLSILKLFIDFFLHIDKNLLMITHQYGAWSYAVLFVVLFLETGFVITPFLPGDSLLFAAGSLAALGSLHIWVLLAICVLAAFTGDTVNYWVGRLIGPQIFERESRFIKKKHLDKAHAFYQKHGGFAIILSRFIPIVRTFAPFVAGISKMSYPTFLVYNVIGGTLWVLLFTLAGFFFGNVTFVRQHFEYVMVAIVLISVVPIAIEFAKEKFAKEKKERHE